MSNPPSAQTLITELQASAHLMLLEPGVYCVHHSPGSTPPDPNTGLPGARLSVPPGQSAEDVVITGFREDGWLGALDSAALIRISQGPAQVLMTIYQEKNSKRPAPKLQVTRLVEGITAPPSAVAAAPAAAVSEPEVAAHIQARGDVLARLGDWIGDRASGRWIEGFALSPRRTDIAPEDLEYQAVLGRGWLSPWAEGGQYCGSRGMALPILGLRVRLKGKAADTHALEVSASFTDGSAIGPVAAGEACEAKSLAPLEAFCIAVVPQSRDTRAAAPAAVPKAREKAAAPKAAPAAKAAPEKLAAKAAPEKAAAKRKAPEPMPPPRKPAKPAPRGRSR